jgi:hypothetical protein
MEIKKSTAFKVPVRLLKTSDGTGQTGVAYTAPTVYIQKQEGSSTEKVLASTDWVEIDSVNMPGCYDLQLSTSDTNTSGFLKYSVVNAAAEVFIGIMEIVSNLEEDTYTSLVEARADLLQVRKISEGRWKINTSTKQLVLYDDDDTTPLITFNLKDSAGTATATNIFERTPV